MVVQNIAIVNLSPYEKNPRRNDRAVKYVAESIRKFGFRVPLVIDRHKVIVAGHTRYKAAQELGLETVPCVVADDLTEEQVRAYRLADNKVSELAQWDNDLLAAELTSLAAFDMSEFGFDTPLLGAEEPPQRFKEYDEQIPTKHRCPKCGYEWS